MKQIILTVLITLAGVFSASAWPGMDMPALHVEGRWLVDENGNKVNLHGFGQTYSPWFNEQGKIWSNYDVAACLKYNQGLIDKMMEAGWKVNYLRLHMDPYWSNTPGVHVEGENDISAFDFNRFRKYLTEVFIPMAEYAVAKGLYVVMRPPGVCPEDIAVGDSYHKYLKRVWGYISSQKQLTDNPHIMFELANEPVRIKDTDGQYRSNTDGCNRNLTLFFQEIVDLMRANGCRNILWIPGTGYQSQYAGFARYPVKGDNIGYAVHVYPGWYGSDALEPSHELGGGYGGHYDAFAAGWTAQVRPVAEIAPIMVTEMDWAPSAYNASWGKSITGKMLGAGFGGNFKIIADNTGNVSWMIFTGPEWLSKFRNEAPTDGKYTFLNDPDACPWPVYHWFREYADEKVETGDAELCISPRTKETKTSLTLMTGGKIGVAVVAQGNGFEMNVRNVDEVVFSDPSVLSWEPGLISAEKAGESECVIRYTSRGEKKEKSFDITSTQFPITSEWFNPSIWETGKFDPQSRSVQTGKYGFAGWKYGSPLDLSEYDTLVAEIEEPSDCALSLRVYDIDNYWSDPAMADFGQKTKVVLDLKKLRSSEGRMMSGSHLYYVGFWSLGNKSFRIKSVYATSGSGSGIGDVELDVENGIVDVFTLQGICLRKGVDRSEALNDLPGGIYIVGGIKIMKLQ